MTEAGDFQGENAKAIVYLAEKMGLVAESIKELSDAIRETEFLQSGEDEEEE